MPAAEARMQREYAATMEVMRSADTDARANSPSVRHDSAGRLQVEQKAWRSYATAKCQFEAEWYGPAKGRQAVQNRCTAEMFKQRVERLRALRQEYDDERQ